MKGIVSVNSIDYVKAIILAWEQGQGVVLLRSEDDVERIKLTDATHPIVRPDLSFGWFSPKYTNRLKDQDAALISFTSGTEGKPKGVLLTRLALEDVVSRLNSVMEVNNTISEYVGVPVNYSFGFGRCRAVAAVGGKCFIPEHGFNLSEAQYLLAQGEINSISAVPSLWRVLLKHSDIFREERLGLKWIEIGSQYMSAEEKLALKSLFPNAAIVQHYGLTEASRSTFLRVDQTSCEYLESVGKVYGKTQVSISSTGRIRIKGPHVAHKIIENGALIDNLDDSEWVQTTDLGELKQGYLFYKGRADDVINCGGIKLSPDVLEAGICQSLNIGPVVSVSKVKNDLTGEGVLVSALDSEGIEKTRLIQQTHEALSNFGINNKSVIKVQFVDEFPKTATGKVQRKRLEEHFYTHHPRNEQSNISTFPPESQELTSNEAIVLGIWEKELQGHDIDLDTDFYNLGGDSLTAIGAIISMERQGVPNTIAKGMLQGLTIRQIARQMDDESHAIKVPSFASPIARGALAINTIRGILVCVVVFAHWWEGLFKRLPEAFIGIIDYMGPILTAGTPAFAVVYGVSVGYALMPIFQQDPKRLQSIIRKTIILLAIGVVTLAMFRFGGKLVEGRVENFTHFTNSFYSVLTYYFLASVTIFGWIKLIKKSEHWVIYALFYSVLMYSLYLFLFAPLGNWRAEGLIELAKISLAAKYSYFSLMAGSLLGIAVGGMLRQFRNDEKHLNLALIMGAGLILSAVALGHQYEENWMKSNLTMIFMHRWLMYAGVITVLFYAFIRLLPLYEQSFTAKQVFRWFAATGMLAFPIFVMHELVIPLKIMLDGITRTGIGLPVALVLFLGVMFYLYRKVYRVSFS